MKLSPYERWMVKSNLEAIRQGTTTVADRVALLRANGYEKIAQAVEASWATEQANNGGKS